MDNRKVKVYGDNDISLIVDRVRIDWCNLDEGFQGDYQPDDPEDVNFLRFDVYRLDEFNEWVEVSDASYCTLVPADTDEQTLIELLNILMNWYYEPVMDGQSVKKMGEQLSWMEPNWAIEGTCPPGSMPREYPEYGPRN